MEKDYITKKRNDIETVFNCFGISDAVIKDMSVRTHREIQRIITDFCVRWLIELSKAEYWDARNERAVMVAKGLMNIPEVRELLGL